MRIARIRIHAAAVPPTPTALYRLEKDLPLGEQIRRETRPKWIAEVETDAGWAGGFTRIDLLGPYDEKHSRYSWSKSSPPSSSLTSSDMPGAKPVSLPAKKSLRYPPSALCSRRPSGHETVWICRSTCFL